MPTDSKLQPCGAAFLTIALLTLGLPRAWAEDWPAFRGNSASIAQSASLPLSWSVETGENVAWTADLPGRGVSSPIAVAGRGHCDGGERRE